MEIRAGMAGLGPRPVRRPATTLVTRQRPPCLAGTAALLNDVILALEAHLRLLLCGGDTPGGNQIIPAHHFRADESLLDVAMNRSGGLDGRGPFVNGPSADLGLARGEELQKAHEVVGGANEAIQAGLR